MKTLADYSARFWAKCWMPLAEVESRAAKVGLALGQFGFARGDREWAFASANDALKWLDGYETAARAAGSVGATV